MKTATIQVKGMSCEGCKAAVENALGGLKGVSAASVSLPDESASIQFDEGLVGEADFKKAVEEAGFSVA